MRLVSLQPVRTRPCISQSRRADGIRYGTNNKCSVRRRRKHNRTGACLSVEGPVTSGKAHSTDHPFPRTSGTGPRAASITPDRCASRPSQTYTPRFHHSKKPACREKRCKGPGNSGIGNVHFCQGWALNDLSRRRPCHGDPANRHPVQETYD